MPLAVGLAVGVSVRDGVGIRPQPGNLLAQPNFASGWTASGATLTPGAALSPTGQANAATLVENSATSTHELSIVLDTTGLSGVYEFSVKLKRTVGTRNIEMFAFEPGFAGGTLVIFDPATGGFADINKGFGVGFTFVDDIYEDAANGFVRIGLKFNISATTSTKLSFLMCSGTSNSYAGDGASTFVLWDAFFGPATLIPPTYGLAYDDDFTSLTLRTGGPSNYGTGPGWIPRAPNQTASAKGYSYPGAYEWNVDPEYPWGGGYPAQGQFSVAGGVLTIRAETTPASLSGKLPDRTAGTPYGWVGGMLNSQAFLNLVAPFHLRVRFKVPPGSKGNWPAIWLANTDQVEPFIEADLMEQINADVTTFRNYLHWDTYAQGDGNLTTVPDMSAGYHDAECRIDSKKIRFYFDGAQSWSHLVPATWDVNRPLCLLINMAMGSDQGGGWVDPPDGTTVSPADFLIDRVRAWKG